jgi:hypothetical protein
MYLNPPLTNIVKSLLYFTDYALEEYEPVLDENTLVYSYGELNARVIPPRTPSPEFDATVEEFLHLHHKRSEPTEQRFGDSRVLFGFYGAQLRDSEAGLHGRIRSRTAGEFESSAYAP